MVKTNKTKTSKAKKDTVTLNAKAVNSGSLSSDKLDPKPVTTSHIENKGVQIKFDFDQFVKHTGFAISALSEARRNMPHVTRYSSPIDCLRDALYHAYRHAGITDSKGYEVQPVNTINIFAQNMGFSSDYDMLCFIKTRLVKWDGDPNLTTDLLDMMWIFAPFAPSIVQIHCPELKEKYYHNSEYATYDMWRMLSDSFTEAVKFVQENQDRLKSSIYDNPDSNVIVVDHINRVGNLPADAIFDNDFPIDSWSLEEMCRMIS